MHLTSVDRQTTIEIGKPRRGSIHAPYKLRVESRSVIGGFSGENDSVYFLNIGEFKAAFVTFIQARKGSVTLRATDDCQLEFFCWNTKGDIGVRYSIGGQFIEGEATDRSSIGLSGRFKLHGEFINQMAAQLLEMLNT